MYLKRNIRKYEGPFIYTGFAPAWVMIKRIDAANDWIVHDYKLGTVSGTGSTKGNIGNENKCVVKCRLVIPLNSSYLKTSSS